MLITKYRNHEIHFDIDNETFYSFGEKSSEGKKSYASIKKEIDEFLKDNQPFKPFEVEGNPLTYSSGKSGETIIGIRKDGRLIAQDKKGGTKQISSYNEKDYIIPVPENEPIKLRIAMLQLKKDDIEKEIREEQKKFTIKTLEDFKKEIL